MWRKSRWWLRAWGAAIGLLLSACAVSQPNGGSSAYDRGLAAYRTGHYGLAAEELRSAVNQAPLSVPALNALGAAYDQIGRFDLAQLQYQKALALDPTSSQTLNNIGYSYLLQNRPDVAAVYLREARQYEIDGTASETVAANTEAAERAIADADIAVATETADPAPPTEVGALRIRRMTGRVQSMETAQQAPASLPTPTAPSVSHAATPMSPGNRPAPPKRQTAAGPLPQPTIHPPSRAGPSLEISNGADRLRMAERMRDHLKSRGWTADRLTDAPHRAHARSVIYYQAGHAEEAKRLQAALAPQAPTLEPATGGGNQAHITLRLGNDMLAFDQHLYEGQTRTETPVAQTQPEPAANDKAPVRTERQVHRAALPRSERRRPAQPQIEVANGAGRNNMAARIADHLTTNGIAVRWVTNANRFDFGTSEISYRPGSRAAATALRRALPANVPLSEDRNQRADAKLTLGADLVSFDEELASSQSSATIEVSNGAGRNQMAARMRAYLTAKGLVVQRISNAERFDHATTTLFYRPGHRAHAQKLSATLPHRIRLQQSMQLATDLQLKMGQDLLGFDAVLLNPERQSAPTPQPG